jgi:hypothetical protein
MGPVGFGPQNYVAGDSEFPYLIEFENATNATAPAQVVNISDFLSTNLDWNTFELGEIGFGNLNIPIPPSSDYFETNILIAYNGVNVEVEIEAGIDFATGEVFANFYSLDPVTQLTPAVNLGFLPPEDGTGRGTGYFSYFVAPNPNLPTGTQITNIAYVQFDENPVIATDQVNDEDPSQGVDTNKMAIVTIDNSPPTSSVLGLPAIETNASFTVQWSGTDNGSGVANYNIYVSTDGGAWTLWQNATANTSATFTGQMYNTYSFVRVATDNVGNQEILRTNADTVLSVTDHTPPVLAAITNYALYVGQGIRFTNVVSDPSVSSPTLHYPPDRFTNFTILATNGLVGSASITTVTPEQSHIVVGTSTGQFLIGSQPLGEIGFNTIADQESAFVYLQTDTPLALKRDGTLADYAVGGQGRVTIVGEESLVEAVLAGGGRTLVVYGPVGASYQVESCNALGVSGAWTNTDISVTMTNIFRNFQLAPDTNSATFYRTRRTQ